MRGGLGGLRLDRLTSPKVPSHDGGSDECTVIVGGPQWGCTGGTGSIISDHRLSGVRAAPVLRKATGAAKTMRAEEWLELRARELRTLGGIIPGGFNVAGLADDLDAARTARAYADHYATVVPTQQASYDHVFVSADVAWIHDPAEATAGSVQTGRWLGRNSFAPKVGFKERWLQRAFLSMSWCML